MKENHCEEECPKCDDGIVKAHKILVEEKKLFCLKCGHKQDYEEMK